MAAEHPGLQLEQGLPGLQLELGHPGLQLELGHPGLQLHLFLNYFGWRLAIIYTWHFFVGHSWLTEVSAELL